MDKKIYTPKDVPDGETLYLKKDLLGWRVVHPIKKDLNAKWTFKNTQWLNFLVGGKRNLLHIIVFLLLIGLIYLGVQEQIANFKTVMDNPCAFCTDCQAQTDRVIKEINQASANKRQLNLSILNLTASNESK